MLSAFKAARLCSPSQVHDIKPTSQTILELKAFPFVSDDLGILGNLKVERPVYIAAAGDVSSKADTLDWWKRNESKVPHWQNACKRALLVQPSSAAAERLFSLLSKPFSDQPQRSLQDYIEASLMLQYKR